MSCSKIEHSFTLGERILCQRMPSGSVLLHFKHHFTTSKPLGQCDQIWRLFTTLAGFQKYLRLHLPSIWPIFQHLALAKFVRYLANFNGYKRPVFEKIILPYCHTAANIFVHYRGPKARGRKWERQFWTQNNKKLLQNLYLGRCRPRSPLTKGGEWLMFKFSRNLIFWPVEEAI